jgi:hypothetical protein
MSQIFILSDDPDEAVQWLMDGDVIRMPILITQVLGTATNRFKTTPQKITIEYMKGDPWLEWVLSSEDNYEALWNYGMDLIDEHYHRFGSRGVVKYKHGIAALLNKLGTIPPIPPSETPYPMPLTPEQARAAYHYPGTFSTYTHREEPDWRKTPA